MSNSGRPGLSAVRPILRFLDETGLALGSSAIVYNLPRWGDWGEYGDPPSRATVQRGLKRCREWNLVDRPEEMDHLYVINDRGRAFIEGELTIDDLVEE